MRIFTGPNIPTASTPKTYGFALLVSIVALLLREALRPLLGESLPFFTVWVAVVFASWYGGTGPGLLTTILTMLGVWFFFLPPSHSFALQNPRADLTGLIGFFILSSLIISMAESARQSSKAKNEAQRAALTASSLFETFMDNSPTTTYLKDREGHYVYTNKTSRERFNLDSPMGKTDFELFPPELAAEYRAHDQVVLRENIAHEFIERTIEADGEHVWLSVKFPVVQADGSVFLGGKSIDITARKRAEDALRRAHDELESRVKERTAELLKNVALLKSEMEDKAKTEEQLKNLSAHLLRLQDEERRHVARDLHDSTGQTLSALKMGLAALEASEINADQKETLTELNALADQAIQEIRTISYLLHPPLLDEAGFHSAATWYVEGFGKRSGIETSLHLSNISMNKEMELALFRVLQESLTNVLRHSKSKAVQIRLTSQDHRAMLSIRDFGCGIPAEKLEGLNEAGIGVGVGIGGMKQRLRQLGGRLDVESGAAGTLVTAMLPLSSGESNNRQDHDTERAVPGRLR
jgi:PAS domain S-box-containing protein